MIKTPENNNTENWNVATIKSLILYNDDGNRQLVIGFIEFPSNLVDEEIEW